MPTVATGNSGNTYTYSQLEGLWVNAGGSTATAPIAAAIAEAESSGRPTVTSSNPDGGTNVGLWQLDTPGGKGAGYTVAQLQDAATNAKVAVSGSSGGTDWSAWSTFASGAYKAFMSNSTTPDTNVPAPDPTSTSTTQTDCLFGKVPGVPIVWPDGFCMLSRSQARAAIGVLFVTAAAGVGLVALVLLAQTIPGVRTGEGAGIGALLGGPAGAAIGGEAGHASEQRSLNRAQDRHDEAIARQVEGRKRDSASGPALRDDERVPF